MPSFEPGEGADEMQPGEKIARGFLVPCCDASELLDVIEEALDQIAFGVERQVAVALDFAVQLGRDDHGDRALLETGDQAVGVIAFCRREARQARLGQPGFQPGCYRGPGRP